MYKSSLRLTCMLCIVWLTACATTTPYQPTSDGSYGYSTQQIENNRFRISFSGNSQTDRATVRNYLLYRAAEVTLQHGADYFVIAHQNTERNVDYATTSTNIGVIGWPFSFGIGLGGIASTSSINRYSAYGVITIHKGDQPADNDHAYDARQVEANLGPLIKRPAK